MLWSFIYFRRQLHTRQTGYPQYQVAYRGCGDDLISGSAVDKNTADSILVLVASSSSSCYSKHKSFFKNYKFTELKLILCQHPITHGQSVSQIEGKISISCVLTVGITGIGDRPECFLSCPGSHTADESPTHCASQCR